MRAGTNDAFKYSMKLEFYTTAHNVRTLYLKIKKTNKTNDDDILVYESASIVVGIESNWVYEAGIEYDISLFNISHSYNLFGPVEVEKTCHWSPVQLAQVEPVLLSTSPAEEVLLLGRCSRYVRLRGDPEADPGGDIDISLQVDGPSDGCAQS